MNTKRKLLFKLNLQLFGSADTGAYDKNDLNPGDGKIDFKIGNNTYSIPEKAFENIGNNSGSLDAKMFMATIYAAYWIETGQNPRDMITRGNDNILNNLKEWYKAQTGQELKVPPDWDIGNLNELNANNDEMQRNLETYLQNGSVTVNGVSYAEWKETQPQFKEGYIPGMGAPVAKDDDGNFIYKNADGSFTTADGEPVPEYTVFNDPITGNPMTLGEDGLFYDSDGNLIKDPNTAGSTSNKNATEDAYNQYYRDLYSQEEGTLGKQILDNNISMFEKEARNAQIAADTSLQNQAIAQSQGIKQVTDALRNERMSQLRAGMSESQLADRELSMLMSSVDQFGNQAQQAAQDSLTAQLGADTAKEQAFNQYIEQTTTLGQNAAANYAAQAGDIIQQTVMYMQQNPNVTWDQAYKKVSGEALANKS